MSWRAKPARSQGSIPRRVTKETITAGDIKITGPVSQMRPARAGREK